MGYMRNAFRLASPFGVDVEADFSFFYVCSYFASEDLQSSHVNAIYYVGHNTLTFA
ncbi:hypothetical protein D3C84_1023060 [compost metagenome]